MPRCTAQNVRAVLRARRATQRFVGASRARYDVAGGREIAVLAGPLGMHTHGLAGRGGARANPPVGHPPYTHQPRPACSRQVPRARPSPCCSSTIARRAALRCPAQRYACTRSLANSHALVRESPLVTKITHVCDSTVPVLRRCFLASRCLFDNAFETIAPRTEATND